MNLRKIAQQIDRSLSAWDPQLLPRLDQLDVITPMPVEDFASDARADVQTPKRGA
jgi:hypothetical protein